MTRSRFGCESGCGVRNDHQRRPTSSPTPLQERHPQTIALMGFEPDRAEPAHRRLPRISLGVRSNAKCHGPQVEVAEQTHSHTPAHDGDAEITQDLFLTKWSSIPGEFEPILAPTVDFGGGHLLRFKTYLGSKRRAHQHSLFADVWRDRAVPGLISTRGRSLGP